MRMTIHFSFLLQVIMDILGYVHKQVVDYFPTMVIHKCGETIIYVNSRNWLYQLPMRSSNNGQDGLYFSATEMHVSL